MTNNAQLLPLIKELNDMKDGGGGEWDSAIVACISAVEEHAIACIEAAKPADAYMHIPSGACFDEVIASVDDSAIVKLTPDALGSLPVVAWMHLQREYSEPMPRRLDQDELNRGWTEYPLTDHAQATAEIAKRDAEIQRHIRHKLEDEQCIAELSAKLAGVDGLLSSMKLIATVNACDYEYQRWAREALATYEAAQGEKK